MSTTQQLAVDVSAVTKLFGRSQNHVRAVDTLDLRIPSGQIMAFLGPNGAGKTTTLDMITGLVEPTSGAISVHGMVPRAAVKAGRISAVLQNGGLLRDLSIKETVQMVSSTFTDPMPVSHVLARAGISHLAKRKISKCSGGEQQRLRFAIALLPNPDLLILDEPTAGMDVRARQEFWDTMRADADSGRTVIFATHYLQEADSFAQRIVMMADGRIVADGSTSQIRAHASGRTVSAFIEPASMDKAATLLASSEQVLSVRTEGSRIFVDAHDSDAVALTLLTELGASQLEVQPASLDQAFMDLTGNTNTAVDTDTAGDMGIAGGMIGTGEDA